MFVEVISCSSHTRMSAPRLRWRSTRFPAAIARHRGAPACGTSPPTVAVTAARSRESRGQRVPRSARILEARSPALHASTTLDTLSSCRASRGISPRSLACSHSRALALALAHLLARSLAKRDCYIAHVASRARDCTWSTRNDGTMAQRHVGGPRAIGRAYARRIVYRLLRKFRAPLT